MIIEETPIDAPPPAVMSAAEVQKVLNELRSGMSAALKAEEEKARQRVVLLQERQYSQERESRVEQAVQAAGAKKRRLPGPSEVSWAKQMAE